MPITDWPLEDRPREKLLTKGEQALTEAELLALILKTGSRGKSALEIAKDLLTQYGSLKNLANVDAKDLIQAYGIGLAKYTTLKAAIELGRRCFQQNLPIKEKLNNSQLTQRFLADRMRDHTIEVFACLFLTTHLHLIHFEELFHGTINEAGIYPREIVRRCLTLNAAKVILAHNHPSGQATPSRADKEITLVIKQALALVDIELVDHIIIGNPKVFSFAEAGLL